MWASNKRTSSTEVQEIRVFFFVWKRECICFYVYIDDAVLRSFWRITTPLTTQLFPRDSAGCCIKINAGSEWELTDISSIWKGRLAQRHQEPGWVTPTDLGADPQNCYPFIPMFVLPINKRHLTFLLFLRHNCHAEIIVTYYCVTVFLQLSLPPVVSAPAAFPHPLKI